MARLTRLSLPGLPHHLMQIGNNRQPIFVDDEDRQAWCAHLREASLVARVDIHAYVLLSNHVHLLATPRDSADGLGTRPPAIPMPASPHRPCGVVPA